MSSQDALPGSAPKSPPSVAQAVAATAAEWGPKAAKLHQLRQVILLEDLRSLAKADREKVRRYETKKLWGQEPTQAAEPEMGDILIADNITIGQPAPRDAAPAEPATPSGQPAAAGALAKLALAAALLGGGAGIGAGLPWLAGRLKTPAPAAAAPGDDTWLDLRLAPPTPGP